MKIYSGTGDDGNTSLADGSRVPKYCDRIESLGSLDELNSWIGLLRDFRENSSRTDFLIYIQEQLMHCSAVVASHKMGGTGIDILPDPDCYSKIEIEIDRIDSQLPKISGFVLPGGHFVVSCCHIARCVCRRSERQILKLKSSAEVPEIIVKFLNRLSDYLFVLCRTLSLELDIQEIKWQT